MFSTIAGCSPWLSSGAWTSVFIFRTLFFRRFFRVTGDCFISSCATCEPSTIFSSTGRIFRGTSSTLSGGLCRIFRFVRFTRRFGRAEPPTRVVVRSTSSIASFFFRDKLLLSTCSVSTGSIGAFWLANVTFFRFTIRFLTLFLFSISMV